MNLICPSCKSDVGSGGIDDGIAQCSKFGNICAEEDLELQYSCLVLCTWQCTKNKILLNAPVDLLKIAYKTEKRLNLAKSNATN